MVQFSSLDHPSSNSVRKEQMSKAFRGCRCAAILLTLSLLLLICGTLLTILPVRERNADKSETGNEPIDTNHSPYHTFGMVLLILGCVTAAAEVVLVIITIFILKRVRPSKPDRSRLESAETDPISSTLSSKRKGNDYSMWDTNAGD